MPRLRRLSGQEVILILAQFGFSVRSQRGSHAKLQRIGPDGDRQTLTIPRHSALDPGTLRAILRQASRYIPLEDLHPHFYA